MSRGRLFVQASSQPKGTFVELDTARLQPLVEILSVAKVADATVEDIHSSAPFASTGTIPGVAASDVVYLRVSSRARPSNSTFAAADDAVDEVSSETSPRTMAAVAVDGELSASLPFGGDDGDAEGEDDESSSDSEDTVSQADPVQETEAAHQGGAAIVGDQATSQDAAPTPKSTKAASRRLFLEAFVLGPGNGTGAAPSFHAANELELTLGSLRNSTAVTSSISSLPR